MLRHYTVAHRRGDSDSPRRSRQPGGRAELCTQPDVRRAERKLDEIALALADLLGARERRRDVAAQQQRRAIGRSARSSCPQADHASRADHAKRLQVDPSLPHLAMYGNKATFYQSGVLGRARMARRDAPVAQPRQHHGAWPQRVGEPTRRAAAPGSSITWSSMWLLFTTTRRAPSVSGRARAGAPRPSRRYERSDRVAPPSAAVTRHDRHRHAGPAITPIRSRRGRRPRTRRRRHSPRRAHGEIAISGTRVPSSKNSASSGRAGQVSGGGT